MDFQVNDRVVRKQLTTRLQVLVGTVKAIEGDKILIEWQNSLNAKTFVNANTVFPISKLNTIQAKQKVKIMNLVQSSILLLNDSVNLDNEGWYYDWYKLPLTVETLNKYCKLDIKRTSTDLLEAIRLSF